MITDQQRLIND